MLLKDKHTFDSMIFSIPLAHDTLCGLGIPIWEKRIKRQIEWIHKRIERNHGEFAPSSPILFNVALFPIKFLPWVIIVDSNATRGS